MRYDAAIYDMFPFNHRHMTNSASFLEITFVQEVNLREKNKVVWKLKTRVHKYILFSMFVRVP